MSDATAAPAVSTPPASAPQAGISPATAPPQGATVTALKPHHSAQQPRAGDGTFSQPEAKPTPTAPRMIRVDDREVPEDELLADYRGRVVDHEAFQRLQHEAAQLRQQMERFKDPYKALDPKQRQEIARRELAEFLAQQEEAKLPPEERQRRQEMRALAAENERLRGEHQQRQQQEQEAQQQADREYAVNMVRSTMKLLGAPEQSGVELSVVLTELRTAAQQGLNYPPETIAHRVRQKLDATALNRVATMPAARLLKNEALVKALNALEDPEALQALAPLIERGRLANLQRIGSAPNTPARPPTAAPTPLQPGQQPRTDAEWAAHFNAGNQPKDPKEFNIFLRLRDRGAVR